VGALFGEGSVGGKMVGGIMEKETGPFSPSISEEL